MATTKSAGWAYQLNRMFNVIFTIQITTLFACVPGKITQAEYTTILTNAWNATPQHYTEADFRQWVADGYITEAEFETITGLEY